MLTLVDHFGAAFVRLNVEITNRTPSSAVLLIITSLM